ncbi:MAG: 3-isopropylmalate dehydratase large subunit [Parahaliea sp.]
MAQTLFEKIWQQHLVEATPDGRALLYIDGQLLHEVTSPQAFEGLAQRGVAVHRPDANLATPDHNVATRVGGPRADAEGLVQLELLERNCRQWGIPCFPMGDQRQGIVHVVGPEQGFTLPGMTLVCGDSHTATHGAFGALAFGIGTAEVEHVLATQTLWQQPQKNLCIRVEGKLPHGVTAKDLIMSIIGRVGTAGATGHVVEYCGSTIAGLSMEARMTLCNMTIEMGARSGLVAPDDTTFAYLKDRPFAPRGAQWQQALAHWRSLYSDPQAHWDAELYIDASALAPQLTWGTSPQDVIAIDHSIPDRAGGERARQYMAVDGGTPALGLKIHQVFIGSCTNGRLEDLQAVAEVVRGRHVAEGVRAMIVPGSAQVKAQAEALGLAELFIGAGFEWRNPGCSMCCGMNEDQLGAGQRAAATSNRNFENRQGRGGRTHLMSPAMAALAAVSGEIRDIRELGDKT